MCVRESAVECVDIKQQQRELQLSDHLKKRKSLRLSEQCKQNTVIIISRLFETKLQVSEIKNFIKQDFLWLFHQFAAESGLRVPLNEY